MDKQKIEDYIKQLQDLETSLMGEDENNDELVKTLDSLLNSLGTDIQSSYGTSVLKIPVKFKKLHLSAVKPTYSKDGDAGMDLTAVSVDTTKDYISYKIGIAVEIPKGYVGLLFPRSSNSKKSLLLSNSVGVIDSGYRGEIEVRFKVIPNKEENYNFYSVGDRVAQLIILPYPQIEFIESDELSSTERDGGGFGHTGI